MAAIDKYIHGIKEKINQIQSDLDIENSKIKRKKLLQEKALYQFFLFIIENEKYKFAEQGQLDWLDNFLCDPIVDNDAKQQLQALIDTVGSQHFNALNTLLLVTIIGGAGFATVAMMINLGLLTGPFIAFLVLSILPITILESSIVATPFACILLMCNLYVSPMNFR